MTIRILLPLILILGACAGPTPASQAPASEAPATSDQAAAAPAPPPQDDIAPAQEGHAPGAGGIRLFYRIYGPTGEPTPAGDADTIVVIHGGPGEHMGWYERDLAPLARERAVVYYDQRGGGRSTLPDDTSALTMDHHVRDLEALRQHLGLTRMTLLAHSFGPAVAALYAIAHPEHVGRLVLIGPIPPRRGAFLEEYGANMAARLGPESLARMEQLERIWPTAPDIETVCREYWQLGIPPRLADPAGAGRLAAEPCAAPPQALRYSHAHTNPVTFASLGDWDWRDALSRLPVPTLVIHGEEEAIPMAMVEEWITALPHARLLRVAGAAHFPYAEQPAIVFPAIEQFLRGQPPAPAP